MAKISFEMDSNAKTFVLTVDGERIDNVESVSAYRRNYDSEGNYIDDDDDDDYCHFSYTVREPEQDGLRREERVCASEQTPAAEQLHKAVAEFMNSRRK